MEIIEVSTPEELKRAWDIRLDVFVGEQQVPIEEEIDDADLAPSTLHVLATAEGTDVGTARLLEDAPGHYHIGRVAVRKDARGTGVGRALMEYLARAAAQRACGRAEIVLSAQEQAMGFYSSLGYEVVDGRTYLDAGIAHQDMRLVVGE
ncbi:putative GNAT family N-acyltransferase [Arcanobacterium wilhelmae]|uniref:GNAT family N-acyltransferase n=1 Tax=Arcanobacterium wilhelmae TaxID=1803177 RepID=A0ABT9N9P1_9ACTO|nr:GNAT family N-acetyltransferase [Arcanobacterium wilhelmae]MDP9800238.1 putative GNAT family N-acyltransferase [Arcanobacterium wilhelmae]WFN89677.1 GNAT family N-acetyltransferase [Arcanobacterium wilhelmae]